MPTTAIRSSGERRADDAGRVEEAGVERDRVLQLGLGRPSGRSASVDRARRTPARDRRARRARRRRRASPHPASVTIARTTETSIAAACVATSSRRVSNRSMITPATSPKSRNGTKRQKASAPTASGDAESSITSHARAMFCIHVPATRDDLSGEEEPVVAVAAERAEGAPARARARAPSRARLQQPWSAGSASLDALALGRRRGERGARRATSCGARGRGGAVVRPSVVSSSPTRRRSSLERTRRRSPAASSRSTCPDSEGAEMPSASASSRSGTPGRPSTSQRSVTWWDVTPRTSVSRRRLRASRRIAGRSSSAISSGERVASLIIREANYT